MVDFDDYFKRQIQLWGKEKQHALKDKRVAIVGCGGLGSSLGFALGSSGIGHIDLVDFDTVSLHNIHRQIALKIEDVGKYKTDILSLSIKKRYDLVNINTYESDFVKFSEKTTSKYDIIFDATDNIKARESIDNYCKSTNTPWVYGTVEQFYGQVCFFDIAVFDKFFKIKQNSPQGITAPMVMLIASFQANLGLRYLTQNKIEKDKIFHFSFDENGLFQSRKFNLGTNI